MSERDDGGPAFPVQSSSGFLRSEKQIDLEEVKQIFNLPLETKFETFAPPTGMSLRDYFAAQLISGAMEVEGATAELAARLAYRIADEMLKARKE